MSDVSAVFAGRDRLAEPEIVNPGSGLSRPRATSRSTVPTIAGPVVPCDGAPRSTLVSTSVPAHCPDTAADASGAHPVRAVAAAATSLTTEM